MYTVLFVALASIGWAIVIEIDYRRRKKKEKEQEKKYKSFKYNTNLCGKIKRM